MQLWYATINGEKMTFYLQENMISLARSQKVNVFLKEIDGVIYFINYDGELDKVESGEAMKMNFVVGGE
jgi:hypothetical protein